MRLAARRDRALGEELLEKLKTEKAEAADNAKLNPGKLNESLSQRLGVARELLETGDMERALQFADPALNVVAMETLNFLADLREKDPVGAVAADKRYAAMLALSANNPEADANTVSLLSSYIFTPHLFVVFTGNGTSTSQMSSTIKPADVSAELRAAFFQTGASILLRPLPPPGQDDVADFDLEGIFKELANQDYERAVELARGFEREGPRAIATIAIARAVLEPRKK